MPEVETVVEAVTESGILFDGEWHDWSRIPERTAELAKIRPQLRKGDTIRVNFSPKKTGKGYWLNTIEILDPSRDVSHAEPHPGEFGEPWPEEEPEGQDTPPGPPEEGDDQYGEHRREKALEQSVLFYQGTMDTTADRVVETAREKFEKYLRG